MQKEQTLVCGTLIYLCVRSVKFNSHKTCSIEFCEIKTKKMFSHKVVKYGIPFMIFVIGGSFGLREFTELRYIYKKNRYINDDFKDTGVLMKPVEEITLEKEYENLQKVDIDNWENIRIQRPWDESVGAKI